jgi:cytochrome P450
VVVVVVLGDPAEPPAVETVSCPVLVLPTNAPPMELTCVTSFLAEVASMLRGPREARPQLAQLSSERLNDPETVGRLRAAGPAHLVSTAGATPTWVLTGHEVVTTTLADPRLLGEVEMTAGFRLSPPSPDSNHRGEQDLVTVSSEEHARLRRLVAQHLTPAPRGEARTSDPARN